MGAFVLECVKASLKFACCQESYVHAWLMPVSNRASGTLLPSCENPGMPAHGWMILYLQTELVNGVQMLPTLP